MKQIEFKQLVKECVKSVLCEKEEYFSGISNSIRQARKEKNPEKILYYRQAYNKPFVLGWDQFKMSPNYNKWIQQNTDQIQKVNQELQRLPHSYIEEESQPEPYDDETDTFSPGPRDRLQGEESDLGIPEYPQAIIKQHNMDGEPRWFIYASSDPQALIIGWGKSSQDAIHNGKTTAKYIKQGGVGHTGELK